MKNLIFLFLPAVFFFSCSNGDKYVGTYELDISKSNLSSYSIDSGSYKGLQVQIKKNRTFKFSKDVPFINKQSGTWYVKGVKDLLAETNYCMFNYGDNEGDDFVQNGSDYIIMEQPVPKTNQKQVILLHFDKIQ